MDYSAITFDGVIDADAKLIPRDAKLRPKADDDKTKTIPTNFNETKATHKK